VNQESSFRVSTAQTIAAGLSRYDLQVTVRSLPYDEYVQALEQGDFDLCLCQVKLTAKAGSGGRLFGAVTTKEISDGLKAQFSIDIPKQKLVLDEPIKAFGSYQVKAKLGFEVSGTVYVTVCEEK